MRAAILDRSTTIPSGREWAAAIALVLSGAAVVHADEWEPVNTQKPGDEPPPAASMPARIAVPDGFEVTLFAAEPDVRQPIGLAFDDRGRLWVAEGYAYGDWSRDGHDRIVILEDTDHDGRFDRRTVFWDRANHLTSVLPGFGGVWMLDMPNLWFIPDADGDDVPDGPPEPRVVGFTPDAEHNHANGLSWGPDGWLYGRHGILSDSRIGLPGEPESSRLHMSCGMWRYHPVERRIEVVFRGMTNPWGHDWDAHGHLFLSGNVNGHFWHGIPGAYYERMFGAGEYPQAYERLRMMAERPHYPGDADWKKVWNQPDVGRAAASEFGGGHSHCGAMIYQGTNWPSEFRGDLFMGNTHGRRINRDSIERKGAGFTSRYQGDVMTVDSPWFRASGLIQAPDGSVVVSDWCDLGECHDHDGVHRTSGRLYRIAFGRPDWPAELAGDRGLADRSDAELAGLLRSTNEWLGRHARRLLQERAAAGGASAAVVADLRARLADRGDEPVASRLRALWALESMRALRPVDLVALLGSPDEHERSWAVRLLCDPDDPGNDALAAKAVAGLIDVARDDPSGLVRLYLASGVARLSDPGAAWRIASALAMRPDLADDPLLELVTWFGIEPLVRVDPVQAGVLAPAVASSKLRRFLARRIGDGLAELNRVASDGGGDDFERAGEPLGSAVAALLVACGSGRDEVVAGILDGLLEALRGQAGTRVPVHGDSVHAILRSVVAGSADSRVRESARELALLVGEPSMRAELVRRVTDPSEPAGGRRRALAALAAVSDAGIDVLLDAAFGDPVLRVDAIGLMQRFDRDDTADRILDAYATFTPEERIAAVETLTTRAAWARRLLEAVGEGTVARTDISPSQAQRLAGFRRDETIRALLSTHWGAVRQTPAEKRESIDRWRAVLTSGELGASDPVRGRELFRATCGACHRLFGEGGNLGPDLTGSGRHDLDYLLENVIDPSASVPTDYWVSVITLEDGRVLAGTIPEQNEALITVRTPVGEQRIDRRQVESVRRTQQSTMPEGLFDVLEPEQVRDLVAYLRSNGGPSTDAPSPARSSSAPPIPTKQP